MPTIATINDDRAIIAEKKVLITSIFFVLLISTADSTDVMIINIEYIKNTNAKGLNGSENNTIKQAIEKRMKKNITAIKNNDEIY